MNELLNTAQTTLVFLDQENNKPMKAPNFVINKFKPYFN